MSAHELATADLERLAQIWREHLPEERQVSGDEGFFESGGDSLGATMILIGTKESLGVDVPLETFFEAPTLNGLAAAVARLRAQDMSS